MNPFIKDHARPLVGSAGLHLLALGAAIFAAWWTVAPKFTQPVAIEAYIATRPSPKPAAAPPTPAPPTAEPAPEPAPEPARAPVAEPPPPAPVPDTRAQERAAATVRERHEEAVRAADGKRQADALAAREHAEAEEAKRDAKRRAETAETQRKADEAKRRAAAAADAQRRADAAQLAVRESDLARQLAQEEHREGAARSGLLEQYITEIQARIERAWNRPPSAKAGLTCTVFVSQVPGGTVTNVRLGDCNGDAAVQQSIILAVHRASPLPMPADPSLFERNLRLVFAPQ